MAGDASVIYGAAAFNLEEMIAAAKVENPQANIYVKLHPETIQGRPKKVSGEDMRWLYDAITRGNPLNYQFEFCLWSLTVIRLY